MADRMTIDKIQEVEAAYRAASAVAEQLRAERNDAIRQAIAAGVSQTKIAKALGVTRGRINQLRKP